METVILATVLLFSFVAHEFAHAWVAWREGDPTAYNLGRVSLNPIRHIDLFGTIIVPAVLIASNSGFLIGWAKPVPIVAQNFRNYRRGEILVSIAGVTANLLIAVLCTVAMIALTHIERAVPGLSAATPVVARALEAGIFINFLLLVFNLLPVPPLDGSRLLYQFLPAGVGAVYRRFEKYGLLLFVVLMLTGTISFVLWPATALTRLSWALIEWST
jgi:Zn-dependent protease